MAKLDTLAAAAVVSIVLAVSPAFPQHGGGGGHGGAHGGEWHGGGGWHRGGGWPDNFFFGFGGVYDPWWGYPYYVYPYGYGYADPYAYPYAYPAPAAPAVAPTAPLQNVWYYCAPSKAYYPYVSSCAAPWQPVPAQPQ